MTVAGEWSQQRSAMAVQDKWIGRHARLVDVQFAGPEEKEANEGKKEQKRGPSLISGGGHCTLRDPGPGEVIGAHYGSIIRSLTGWHGGVCPLGSPLEPTGNPLAGQGNNGRQSSSSGGYANEQQPAGTLTG